MAQPDFWADPGRARKILSERSRVEAQIEMLHRFERTLEDLDVMFELSSEDESLIPELRQTLARLQAELAEAEIRTMLSGEHDAGNAIVTIKPGAGGTDAQDWAEMLLRMYLRWAEKHGYKTELLEQQAGQEAGIKSATFRVEGPYAYGYLKAEAGVHRLVRLSPFNIAQSRETSFASVFVSPELDDDIEIEINEADLKIDTFRSSGAGGQHVNKTSSAVRLTHLPTGLVVACQQERSQHKNRETAMKMLRAALYQRKLDEQEAARAKLEATKTDISWGNQIRSYVFQPYTMVNDHRTELKVGDVQRVMDGDLDPFIQAFLKRFGGAAA